MFGPLNMALVAQGNRPRGNKSSQGTQAMKGSHPPQKGRPKHGIAKKQKAKGNGEKYNACEVLYCGKKGHYARDCPEPQKIQEQVNI